MQTPNYNYDKRRLEAFIATGNFSIIGIMGLVIAIPFAYINIYLSFGLGIKFLLGTYSKRNSHSSLHQGVG